MDSNWFNSFSMRIKSTVAMTWATNTARKWTWTCDMECNSINNNIHKWCHSKCRIGKHHFYYRQCPIIRKAKLNTIWIISLCFTDKLRQIKCHRIITIRMHQIQALAARGGIIRIRIDTDIRCLACIRRTALNRMMLVSRLPVSSAGIY